MRGVYLAALVSLVAVGNLLSPAVYAEDKKPAKVSTEMKDFMKQLNGNEKSVNAALKKYAAPKVDTSDMEGIQVREPRVTKTEAKDGQICYTIAVKTGILDRTYLICWKDKKIQKLKQLSIK
jgi:hypothetical protein